MKQPKQPDSRQARTQPSDEDLMTALREGDADSLGTLLGRYWGDLMRYAMGSVRRPEDAEDVVQEVFVRLWEHRKRWVPTGSVRAYLFQIARNLLIGRARHRKVRDERRPELRWLARGVTTPVEDIEHTELREALEEALESLPERRREAFVLVRFQGFSLREAAQVMEVTRRTVANHVYMAATDLEGELDRFLS